MLKKVFAGFLVSALLFSGNTAVIFAEEADLATELGLTGESKPAMDDTVEKNQEVYTVLDFEDKQEEEFSKKGKIEAPEKLEITAEDGSVVWSQAAYDFLETEECPGTVNPSLWENTKNNHAYGLFEVTDGIYQVRGYDMANLTVIAGEKGWIVFDPLMSTECSKAAMELIEKNLGERPISAVVISHPHVDHFGGIGGVITEDEIADSSLSIEEQLASGKIPIIVPEGFAEHAIAENLYAGQAMSRRAGYQYGKYLEDSETGKLSVGIGMGQSTGILSFFQPTYEIKATGETLTVDGVEMEFQMTPGTEAPSEMNTWFPEKKALWVAENCTATLHNLYTLRGAEVRDGNEWAEYIMEALERYGDEAEVTFQSHNWPHWGNEVIKEYLTNTAAVYKFINDQTLVYINQGYTSNEISNMIKLPDELAKNWYTRQYYGTVAHNSKAVYQKYMGWYDANPVNLNPLTPSDSAEKWVEYLGDTDEVLRKAKEDFDQGEYQWVAEVTNTIIYADPENTAARYLCADALEQLGYQAESGTWRNVYLTGAKELREGNQAEKANSEGTSGAMISQLTPEMIFEYMGILLNKTTMAGEDFVISANMTDSGEHYKLWVKNGVLLYAESEEEEEADLTLSGPAKAYLTLLSGKEETVKEKLEVKGDESKLRLLIENLNELNAGKASSFNIVEP